MHDFSKNGNREVVVYEESKRIYTYKYHALDMHDVSKIIST